MKYKNILSCVLFIVFVGNLFPKETSFSSAGGPDKSHTATFLFVYLFFIVFFLFFLFIYYYTLS